MSEEPFRTVGLISYPDTSKGEVTHSPNCTYHIMAPKGKVINFRFLTFQFPGSAHTECLSYIVMYDFEDRIWNTGCTSGYPSSVTTTSNVLTLSIVVVSGAHSSNANFVATYRLQDHVTHCNHSHSLHPGDTGIVSSPHFPRMYPGNIYCTTTITVIKPRHHIQIAFEARFHVEWSAGCQDDYLQIDTNPGGTNDKHTPASLTTYCGTIVPHPLVSRGNSLEITFKSDFKNAFIGFEITYTVKKEVPCSSDEFRCSPVKCIDISNFCDGIVQCTNARDEHCGPSSASGTLSACFLCGDGECVQPSFPSYGSGMSDRHWWWLCDGYAHCQDGTDETPAVCEQRWSRSGALFWCLSQSNPNSSIAILATWVCDGISHCYEGIDESVETCKVTLIETPATYFNDIYLPLCVSGTLLLIIIIFYNYRRIKQKCSHDNITYSNLLITELDNSLHQSDEASQPHNDVMIHADGDTYDVTNYEVNMTNGDVTHPEETTRRDGYSRTKSDEHTWL